MIHTACLRKVIAVLSLALVAACGPGRESDLAEKVARAEAAAQRAERAQKAAEKAARLVGTQAGADTVAAAGDDSYWGEDEDGKAESDTSASASQDDDAGQ